MATMAMSSFSATSSTPARAAAFPSLRGAPPNFDSGASFPPSVSFIALSATSVSLRRWWRSGVVKRRNRGGVALRSVVALKRSGELEDVKVSGDGKGFPGDMCAVNSKDEKMRFVGISRRVSSNLLARVQDLQELCGSVKVALVDGADRSASTEAWKHRIQEHVGNSGETPSGNLTGEIGGTGLGNFLMTAWTTVSGNAVGALLMGMLIFGVSSAEATDALKTCGCLLKECRVELARCIADPGCAANVACLQTCNNRPDETECQIKCGDLFENKVVDQFNDCAVSRKGCVPQKKDEGLFPVPPSDALVQNFKTAEFSGKWYISSGLNRTFDTFDCQLHEFSPSSPNAITAKLAWRIPTPDGGFITRSAVQNFVQDKREPGKLYNHDNEFLHYQDDWYILASKTEKGPDDYIFIYYRGSNDAWDGYGGAVVYTRSKTLPQNIIPELRNAAQRVGLDFAKFTSTDNTCGPEPPLLARLEKKVEEGEELIVEEVEEEEQFLVQEVKQALNSVGRVIGDAIRGESDFLGRGAAELKREEELFLKGLGDEERALLDQLQMEASDIEKLFGKALPIRKSQ